MFPRNAIKYSLALTAAAAVLAVFCLALLAVPQLLFWVRFGKAMAPSGTASPPDKLYGVIDQSGNEIVPPNYRSIGDYHSGLALVEGKPYKMGESDNYVPFGYIDTRGNFVIKQKFLFAESFSEDRAMVCTSIDLSQKRFGYIDPAGKTVIPGIYVQATSFKDGFAIVTDSRHVLSKIDINGHPLRDARLASLAEYTNMSVGQHLDDPMFMMLNDGLETYDGELQQYGKPIARGQWVESLDFSEGRAAVQIDKLWGYIDKTGKLVIPAKFTSCASFRNGLARAAIGEKWGFIDMAGKFVIKPQFSALADFAESKAAFAKPAVNGDNHWGFIDSRGKVLIAPKFLAVHQFSEGKAAVQMLPHWLWGFIDSSGSVIIEARYDDVSDFHANRAVIARKTFFPANH
ncbi:MAG TPA: WG repeat-containing protein [Chroococcales cyanobacterium]